MCSSYAVNSNLTRILSSCFSPRDDGTGSLNKRVEWTHPRNQRGSSSWELECAVINAIARGNKQ